MTQDSKSQPAPATIVQGVRCHNADVCCAGQLPCPTPAACQISAAALAAAPHAAAASTEPQPIDMVLHCPACGMQHIDAPEEVPGMPIHKAAPTPEHPHRMEQVGTYTGQGEWTNPPHRSHLCHGCGHVWRPADVPTNGVAAVKTKGKADSPVVAQAAASGAPVDAAPHPDDAAVDRFAAAMKAKLAAARAKGRSGWNDPTQYTADDLAIDLRKHVNKGDPVDVANFAMFLHARGESTKLRPLSGDLIEAIKAAPAGTSAIEHGNAVVFVSREDDHSAPTLLLGEINHRELNAQVIEVEYLAGKILLQVTGDREVPQDLHAGAEVDILYQAEDDGQEGSAA